MLHANAYACNGSRDCSNSWYKLTSGSVLGPGGESLMGVDPYGCGPISDSPPGPNTEPEVSLYHLMMTHQHHLHRQGPPNIHPEHTYLKEVTAATAAAQQMSPIALYELERLLKQVVQAHLRLSARPWRRPTDGCGPIATVTFT